MSSCLSGLRTAQAQHCSHPALVGCSPPPGSPPAQDNLGFATFTAHWRHEVTVASSDIYGSSIHRLQTEADGSHECGDIASALCGDSCHVSLVVARAQDHGSTGTVLRAETAPAHLTPCLSFPTSTAQERGCMGTLCQAGMASSFAGCTSLLAGLCPPCCIPQLLLSLRLSQYPGASFSHFFDSAHPASITHLPCSSKEFSQHTAQLVWLSYGDSESRTQTEKGETWPGMTVFQSKASQSQLEESETARFGQTTPFHCLFCIPEDESLG